MVPILTTPPSDLAAHCRLLLHNRPRHRLLYRWGVLYPLYVLSEVAIICTDLAELLGSATALTLLFPALPLWAGVLLTASDVFIVLALSDPTQGRRQKAFEIIIGLLVLAVIVCLIVVMAKVQPNMAYTMDGFVPSRTLIKPGALYTCTSSTDKCRIVILILIYLCCILAVGIIGATVMPHALFLGSSLAKQDRVGALNKPGCDDTLPGAYRTSWMKKFSLKKFLPSWQSVRSQFMSFKVPEGDDPNLPNFEKGHAGWTNKTASFVVAHLNHSIVDITISLLGFAVVINSMFVYNLHAFLEEHLMASTLGSL